MSAAGEGRLGALTPLRIVQNPSWILNLIVSDWQIRRSKPGKNGRAANALYGDHCKEVFAVPMFPPRPRLEFDLVAATGVYVDGVSTTYTSIRRRKYYKRVTED